MVQEWSWSQLKIEDVDDVVMNSNVPCKVSGFWFQPYKPTTLETDTFVCPALSVIITAKVELI